MMMSKFQMMLVTCLATITAKIENAIEKRKEIKK